MCSAKRGAVAPFERVAGNSDACTNHTLGGAAESIPAAKTVAPRDDDIDPDAADDRGLGVDERPVKANVSVRSTPDPVPNDVRDVILVGRHGVQVSRCDL